MKNIFGVDITKSKENTRFDGNVFISKRLTPALQMKMDSCFSSIAKHKKSVFSIIIKIMYYLLLIILICFIKADAGIIIDYFFYDGISFKDAFNNAPYLFYFECCVIVLFIFTVVVKIKSNKKIAENIVSEMSDNDFEKIMDEAIKQLDIPDNAYETDVLSYRYKTKNNKDKLCSYGTFDYRNLELLMYVQDFNLNFAEICEGWVMSIPLSSFKSMVKVKKRALVPYWNKSNDYCSDFYKHYKITKNGYGNGNYFVYYYKITIQDIKGDFELFIPNYDISRFHEFTLMRTDEE